MLSKYKKDEIKKNALTALKFDSYTNGIMPIKAEDVLELLKEVHDLADRVKHLDSVKDERDKYFEMLRKANLMPN